MMFRRECCQTCSPTALFVIDRIMKTSTTSVAMAAATAVAVLACLCSPIDSFVFRSTVTRNQPSPMNAVKLSRPQPSPLHQRSPQVFSAGRRRCTSMQSAATTEQDHGSVTFLPENDELAAEETVEIVYSPPGGMFEGAESLLYCGGFNGWDGEEDAVTMPMMPVEDGRFRISINVPNFARVLDFVVTDGVRYDTGPDGEFYHALVTHVREADKTGNIITYRQEADGTLIKTGVIEKVDPQELERMMDEATKAQNAAAAPQPEAGPMVDDTMAEVEQGLRQEITVTIDEQDAVQKMRAEASILGERLGLGNMQVNEARDAFDMYDSAAGLLKFEDVGKLMDKLGFDELSSTQQAELIGTHVLEKRPDATSMTLIEFIYLFKSLDDLDIGIDMC